MKPMNKLAALRGAVALAAVLAMSGTAMAKKGGNAGLPADLNPERTQATFQVPDLAACDAATTTASLTVYIFQSVGRLINIGTFSEPITCTGVDTAAHDVTVTAIPGFLFQPGPASYLIQYTTNVVDPVTMTTVPSHSYSGGKLNLHP